MGICASCLGLGRRTSDSESDSSHLLGDSFPHYGSISNSGPQGGPPPDPEELRRMRDALERICAQTNDKMIDVSQATYTQEGSKMASEYPRLFNERFAAANARTSRPPSPDTAVDDEAAWLENTVGKAGDADAQWGRVATINGALTVQFGAR
ncbi:hypothetical protein P154DRAFT_438958 [Amniculicola lignicola CBS 123094]|uniref:Late endosomal/lysosomal adaptor and MAPK and MTOR activator-domain-containing protein n=1 Tax=Amniculicola lignicola CBS 123094 TaxID=1392246 RepID=A0A6A5W9J0_9PLEO|nr:hypothetical protein P154DRAFT_438958 [Amniculicola lignicola CBS 123094]